MGVFDFLYKTPDSKRYRHHHYHHRRSGYGPAGSTPNHYRQRTVTRLNKDSVIPSANDNDSKNNVSLNQHRVGSKIRYDNINDDDFTRLSRLENKIDSYVTRHNEIADELESIRSNLSSIEKEFKIEYNDDIHNGKKNKHVVEIADRILAKLNSIKINDPDDDKVQHNQQPAMSSPILDHSIEPRSDHHVDIHEQTMPKSYSSRKVSDNKTPTTQSPAISPSSTPVKIDNVTSPKLVRAHYAIVSDDYDNYNDINANKAYVTSIYASTPTLNQQNQSSMAKKQFFDSEGYSPVRSLDDDDSIIKHSAYVNMSSRMHSENPIIEHCFREIEMLRKRMIGYSAEHKLSSYKQFDNEISALMNELEKLDFPKETLFALEKNTALCELHNLAGVLERSIQCRDPNCILCNSFLYKPEISV